jgi:hypothetical protein
MKQVNTDSIMLNGMVDCLSVAVENAVLEWKDSISGFFDKFIESTLADSFSKQVPFVTTGINGEELVALIYERITGVAQTVKWGNPNAAYSEFYWVGYAIALFTALSGVSIKQLLSVIPANRWLQLYPLMHEYGDDLLLEKLWEIYYEGA